MWCDVESRLIWSAILGTACIMWRFDTYLLYGSDLKRERVTGAEEYGVPMVNFIIVIGSD